MKSIKIAILILLLALIYTRIELNQTKQNYLNLSARYIQQADKLDEVYQVSQEFDQLSGETLISLIEDYQETIEIYDQNVEIYNSQIQDLYDIVTELDTRQQTIINYLR